MVVLDVIGLSVEVDSTRILNGVNLTVKGGEVVAVLGPNGSGKSTLFQAIAGHPRYKIVEGDIRLDGKSILDLPPEERVKKGIVLVWQNPVVIPEVRVMSLISAIINKRLGRAISDTPSSPESAEALRLAMQLGLKTEHLARGVHHGFSGGESKRLEVLIAAVLKPRVLLLDEPDSGVDIDGIARIGEVIRNFVSENTAILISTHTGAILRHVRPTRVVVLYKGRIVYEGDEDVIQRIEELGYDEFLRRYAGVE